MRREPSRLADRSDPNTRTDHSRSPLDPRRPASAADKAACEAPGAAWSQAPFPCPGSRGPLTLFEATLSMRRQPVGQGYGELRADAHSREALPPASLLSAWLLGAAG